jgi:hypothetical protein
MTRIERYATEAEIATASLGSKLNFGGNLYMKISKKGDRAFHFRVCLDGKDTTYSLGKFPDLSLSDARRIAIERQGEVVQARMDTTTAAFRARLRGAKQKSALKKVENLSNSKTVNEGAGFAGFRSLEDAGKFIYSLWKNKDSMLPEMYIWLRLKLLIPSRSAHLLSARWSDLDRENRIWTVRRPGSRQSSPSELSPHVAVLSPGAMRGLDKLREVTGSQDDLFPTLKSMSASSLRRSIRQEIERAWPQYYVDPDEFATFFERVAKKYSLFHPTLVDGMLAHKRGNPADYNHETYVFQLHGLANWWSETLTWFDSGESIIQWGGIWVPPPSAQGRPRWGW